MAFVTDLGGLLYEVVRETWFVTSVVAKYYVPGLAAYLIYESNFSWEALHDELLETGEEFILIMFGIGIIASALSIEIRPVAPFFSQFIAVIYLGYLFWKY